MNPFTRIADTIAVLVAARRLRRRKVAAVEHWVAPNRARISGARVLEVPIDQHGVVRVTSQAMGELLTAAGFERMGA